MKMEKILNTISKEFNNHVSAKSKRPGIMQLYLPLYHEDGDMIDIFLTETKEGVYKLSDYGMTLQRLAYTYDIDTEHKEKVLQKIITENKLLDDNGSIGLLTTPETVFGDIMHLTSAYSKIGSMGYFKREVVENLFYEILDEFIFTELQMFKPEKGIYPIPERNDLLVDYKFSPNGHPIYLLGVKDSTQAKLATISCLEFQKANLNYRGWVVNEDFNKLPKNDRTRLTSACDKQFPTIEDFKQSAKLYLERERK